MIWVNKFVPFLTAAVFVASYLKFVFSFSFFFLFFFYFFEIKRNLMEELKALQYVVLPLFFKIILRAS